MLTQEALGFTTPQGANPPSTVNGNIVVHQKKKNELSIEPRSPNKEVFRISVFTLNKSSLAKGVDGSGWLI